MPGTPDPPPGGQAPPGDAATSTDTPPTPPAATTSGDGRTRGPAGRTSAAGGAPEDPALPDLGAVGLARYAWRQLTSMRTALFLLMLLAVAAVPGSLLPQRGVDPGAVTQYLEDHPRSAPWLDRLGFFEVYASPWFAAIYLLLFISLVGCVLPRAKVHWTASRARPARTPRRLDRMPARVEVPVAATAEDDVLEAARSVLRSRRYRVDVRSDENGGRVRRSVAAERGYVRETGNVVFHLSLIGLLVAIALGSLFGYRGETLVTVGGSFSNSLVNYDSIDPGTRFDAGSLAPFRFTLDELTATFEEDIGGNQFAAPRDFEAVVTLVEEPGAEPRQETIKVNQPLAIGNVNVYLSGNGYAPVITVRDGNGDVAFQGPVPFLPLDAYYTSNGVLKAPDAAPEQIGIQALLLPTYVLDEQGPRSIFPDARDPRIFFTAWVGDLGLDDGVPQSVFRLDTEGLTQLETTPGDPFRSILAPGQSVDLPDGHGSVTFEELQRFAALKVRYDPGKVPALVFSVIAMTGLIVSLFTRRRRVWVRVADGAAGERMVVEVAGLARGDDPGLDAEVRSVADALGAAVGRAPDHESDPGDPGPVDGAQHTGAPPEHK